MAKLVILADNNSLIDQYYLAEPAVSYYLQLNQYCVLFDAGFSDVFLINAKKKGIDLDKVDAVVFSHGHNDHVGGIQYIPNIEEKRIITHPNCFLQRRYGSLDIGISSSFKIDTLKKLEYHTEITQISKDCFYLGEIPVYHTFEKRSKIGEHYDCGWKEDTVVEDSGLVILGNKGLWLITGCSHSGICNMIEHVKKNFKIPIYGVIGGLHLLEMNDRVIQTIKYLKQVQIQEFYPSHCVSLEVKMELSKSMKVHEVGVGMEIEL